MPPVTWYLRRLQAMSPEELGWRVRSTLRDHVDRACLTLGRSPAPRRGEGADRPGVEPGFRVSDVGEGEWAGLGPETPESGWLRRLRDRADRIARHRLSFFDLVDRDLGDPIDWNRDHGSGKRAPMRFAPAIDYRDFQVTGDAKVVWEPNRHHQLVVLGRAYRASGEATYAAAIGEQLESWLDQCPFGMGMNWRSPLELAIRLINWVWTLDLIRESGRLSRELRSRVRRAVYLHLWEITRKYSRGSSGNNHRIGEAAGVFVATAYFHDLPDAPRWREESHRILAEEILAQTYPDGCTREQALGYHLFVLQFFLIAGIVARWIGHDLSRAYWARLERMLEFVGALSEGGRDLPMFGDSDDGYVLDLGEAPGETRGLLATGAVLFARPDFKRWSGGYVEPARWLLGRASRVEFDRLPATPPDEPLASRAFAESGHYLLQHGRSGRPDRVSVTFDCGELGFQSIAAHGHADALSFTLRAFGTDVFVDPGTYDYFSFPRWREYFRSTRAHNTVVIDGADQSVMLGPFLWGARARARRLRWEPRSDGGLVAAEHDGYTRLGDPVMHRRTLELDGRSRVLTLRDEIAARGRHDIEVCFHLSEHCVASHAGGHRYEITVGGGTVTLEVDPRLSVTALSGSEDPLGGWVSRGYHRKVPSTTLVGRGESRGTSTFITHVHIGPPG
jgi:Heparinase II/III-like protein/Heparinase II/III N-terminus